MAFAGNKMMVFGGIKSNNDFIFTIDLSKNSGNHFTIPTTGIGYLYDVDWGDGIVTTGHTDDATHTYKSQDIFTIKIKGVFPQFSAANQNTARKIRSIDNWGIYGVGSTTQNRAFLNFMNLLSVTSVLDVAGILDFQRMFQNCTKLESLPMMDTSLSSSFDFFNDANKKITTVPPYDFSNATRFLAAWRKCYLLEDFQARFYNCNATNFHLAFDGTNLNQTSIDGILVSIESNGTSNGMFKQRGGSAPSVTGEAAITLLRSRGWTINVTGGF